MERVNPHGSATHGYNADAIIRLKFFLAARVLCGTKYIHERTGASRGTPEDHPPPHGAGDDLPGHLGSDGAGGGIAFAGASGILSGVCGIQTSEFMLAPFPISLFVTLWLRCLAAYGRRPIRFLLSSARAKRDEPVFSASMKAAFAALAPAFITGAAFTFCFRRTGFSAIRGVDVTDQHLLGYSFTDWVFWPRATSRHGRLRCLGWAFLISGIVVILIARLRRRLIRTSI